MESESRQINQDKMGSGVSFDIDGSVARVTLDRPEAGNAIDLALARALLRIAIACDEDPAIRCVLLTGSGRMFCAGGDINAFAHAGDATGALLAELTSLLHAAIARFARMGKPLVTAVNGPAAGAGLSLAILGDIALAAPEARFVVAYTGIGLSPDGGATWLLPRLVGLRRAQELALRNSRLDAEHAATIGLVTRVTAPGALMAEAAALAAELAQGPTAALGATRRLLLDSMVTPLETQMEFESRSIAAQSRHPHGREGIAAFLSKRSPKFE